MTARHVSLLLLISCLLVGCGNEDDASVEAVRAATAPIRTMTNGELAEGIAGDPGTVRWQVDDGENEGKDAVSVSATIERATVEGKRIVILRYRHHPAAGVVTFEGISVDGRPVGLLRGTTEIMRLMGQ